MLAAGLEGLTGGTLLRVIASILTDGGPPELREYSVGCLGGTLMTTERNVVRLKEDVRAKNWWCDNLKNSAIGIMRGEGDMVKNATNDAKSRIVKDLVNNVRTERIQLLMMDEVGGVEDGSEVSRERDGRKIGERIGFGERIAGESIGDKVVTTGDVMDGELEL